MEHEKPPYVPPMNGKEVLAMFGDRQLLAMEAQRDRLGDRVDAFSREIAAALEDAEFDAEEMQKMEADLHVAQETLKETNKQIRKLGQAFGTKRGPVTLH